MILGASGGVGLIAVQIARWLDMKSVVGTCSASNSEFVQGLGAHKVFDYSSEKVEGVFDVVLDCVGGRARDECLGNVKEGGILVSVAEPISEASRTRLTGVKCVFFIVEPDGAQLAEACKLIEQGCLRPMVGRIFSLDNGKEAFAVLGERHTRGKIVLEV